MKLVIQTQIRENYGDVTNPYWKFKGGNIYIFPNLTRRHIDKIRTEGIPMLSNLISSENSHFQEWILGWDIVLEDSMKACEDWDDPWILSFIDGQWQAFRETLNGEYGYMRKEIDRKVEQYVMLPGGERDNYRVQYIMRNGDIVTGEDFGQYLEQTLSKRA